jgi:methylphosphotriester-DNA--protein-cysteine methyltransferase
MKAAMVYLARTPPPPLDTFVERIWYCSDAGSQARERVLPGGGTMDLAFNLADDDIRVYDANDPALVRAHSGALVAGTRTQSCLIDPRQRTSVIGVHFRPGGAFPFLGIAPAELVDAHAQLDELWGCAGRNLREQLVEARSASEQFQLVEAALLRRVERARPGHPAVRLAVNMLRAGGNEVRVAEVAAAVNLSHRRFAEVFEREVGLTPKCYARLQRFHGVKQRIAVHGEPPSWATFAVACGYFDQAHMIRDFVAFSGMSPTSYLRGQTTETMFDHFVHAYGTDVARVERARPNPNRVAP